MKFVGLIDDDEMGKVELWIMKKETAKDWNEVKDDLMLRDSTKNYVKNKSMPSQLFSVE